MATDDPIIKDLIRKSFPGIAFFHRSKKTLTDSARVESCVRQFLLAHDEIQNLIFFPGANSAWFTADDVHKAIIQYERTDAASLITVAPLRRYLYSKDLQGWISPLTSETVDRGFLGNLSPVWIENGSFYIFNRAAFLLHDSFRIEPCTGFVMGRETERELDTKLDLAVINTVKRMQ
jgi:CMP-N-acetylneuraminic acid synthetase